MIITDSLPPQGQKKIIILGDLIIDETWYVTTSRLSPEAPVPVASLINKDPIITPGGAGLAATYATKHNIPSIFVSSISNESLNILDKSNINYCNITKLDKNIKKIRYIDEASHYHLIRIDNDNLVPKTGNYYLTLSILENLFIKENIKCLSMLNYRKGVFKNNRLCQDIITLANKFNIPTFVDTRGIISKFKNTTIAKLNEKELKEALARLNIVHPKKLREELNIEQLIITKAAKGAEIYTKTDTYIVGPKQLPGTPDVTGAGDVFDINFCYHYFLKTQKCSILESLQYSVNKATEFIREPINVRLK